MVYKTWLILGLPFVLATLYQHLIEECNGVFYRVGRFRFSRKVIFYFWVKCLRTLVYRAPIHEKQVTAVITSEKVGVAPYRGNATLDVNIINV